MTLVFDLAATQSISGVVHGGGEYAKTVFRHLLGRGASRDVIAFFDGRLALDEDLARMASLSGVNLIDTRGKSDIQAVVRANSGGRFFSALPYQYHDLDFEGMDVVFTIHGLRSIEAPSDWYEYRYAKGVPAFVKWAAKRIFSRQYVGARRAQMRKLLSTSAASLTVVADSQHTKYALRNNIPELASEKVIVLYAPETKTATISSRGSSILERIGLETRGYILLVSGDRWVKNSVRGLMAMQDLIAEHGLKKHVVVAGGAPRWAPGRWKEVCTFLPYVEEKDLAALYESAFCLFYPTLNEGFGYPPLEAMRYGTPVVCSAITSTSEILGEAPLYCSPYSQSEMQNRILCLLEDNEIWAEKSAQSQSQYQLVARRQRDSLDQLVELICA